MQERESRESIDEGECKRVRDEREGIDEGDSVKERVKREMSVRTGDT